MTLFENRVAVAAINQVKMRPDSRVGPYSNDWCVYKSRLQEHADVTGGKNTV